MDEFRSRTQKGWIQIFKSTMNAKLSSQHNHMMMYFIYFVWCLHSPSYWMTVINLLCRQIVTSLMDRSVNWTTIKSNSSLYKVSAEHRRETSHVKLAATEIVRRLLADYIDFWKRPITRTHSLLTVLFIYKQTIVNWGLAAVERAKHRRCCWWWRIAKT